MSVVRLGFEVGTGQPVDIPLAHTFVTGQTQLSGKTTTLRAIVERSGRRALVFVTKRGETFDGRRIAPYLPREGEQPIHWRLVETILAAALGQRSMKYERLQLVNAVKSPRVATTLQGVRDNVTKLVEKAKGKSSGDIYLLIGEYLDLVLPEMKLLAASDELELPPGLNVMDLSHVGQQLQALVIRASLEHINRLERDILTVFPEAWEFAPRGTNGPAKEPAIAMVRKGAVLGNYLLCDSQDIAGVDTVIRQGASVWILGVQRELNELKRTIQTIPAGIKRPKPEDVATLERGQFYACWGKHAVKTYVQPSWMGEAMALQVARGEVSASAANALLQHASRPYPQLTEVIVTEKEARELRENNERLERENADLRRRLDALESAHAPREDRNATRREQPPVLPSTEQYSGSESEDELFRRFKARLVQEAPAILRVIGTKPELRVEVERQTITADGRSLRGRIARLISEGFFAQSRTSASVLDELLRRGADRPSNIELGNEMKALTEMGFFTRENKWYTLVPDMVVNVAER